MKNTTLTSWEQMYEKHKEENEKTLEDIFNFDDGDDDWDDEYWDDKFWDDEYWEDDDWDEDDTSFLGEFSNQIIN